MLTCCVGGTKLNCSVCGKEVPAGALFCPSCGRVIKAASAQASPAAPRTRFTDWFVALATWQKALLVIFGGIFLIAGFAITLALVMTSGLDDPVDRYFAALHAGNVDAAYQELSIATQQQNPIDGFKAMVARSSLLTHIVGHSFNSRSFENDQGALEGTLETDRGGKVSVVIHLIKENGQWKIMSYHLGPSS